MQKLATPTHGLVVIPGRHYVLNLIIKSLTTGSKAYIKANANSLQKRNRHEIDIKSITYGHESSENYTESIQFETEILKMIFIKEKANQIKFDPFE